MTVQCDDVSIFTLCYEKFRWGICVSTTTIFGCLSSCPLHMSLFTLTHHTNKYIMLLFRKEVSILILATQGRSRPTFLLLPYASFIIIDTSIINCIHHSSIGSTFLWFPTKILRDLKPLDYTNLFKYMCIGANFILFIFPNTVSQKIAISPLGFNFPSLSVFRL